MRRHILRFPVYTDQFLMGSSTFNQQQQQPFVQTGFQGPIFQKSNPAPNKNVPRRRRRRRQLNIPPNINFQQQQQIPIIQQQQQIPLVQQQQQIPLVQQQQLPIIQQQQQPLNPTQNPSYYQIPTFPSSAIFQDGQIYPTMDPTFSIQAQISSGPNGNSMYICISDHKCCIILLNFVIYSRNINWSPGKLPAVHSCNT